MTVKNLALRPKRWIEIVEDGPTVGGSVGACNTEGRHRVTTRQEFDPVGQKGTRPEPRDKAFPRESGADPVFARPGLTTDRPGTRVQGAVETRPVQIET